MNSNTNIAIIADALAERHPMTSLRKTSLVADALYLLTFIWALAAIPVALFEFSLGVWLVVKGFKPLHITGDM
ncbi:MAG TPA: hypothetical protein VK508_15515 [Cyclobacteriaceae bacterium]|nr:hypothetical protein [Cyclobacteriaceae bacterium]